MAFLTPSVLVRLFKLSDLTELDGVDPGTGNPWLDPVTGAIIVGAGDVASASAVTAALDGKSNTGHTHDHGTLTGLTTGNPHTQYALLSGAAFTGDVTVGVGSVLTAGPSSAGGGSILEGTYSGSNRLAVFGSLRGSGSPALGYAVKPSTTVSGGFVSSAGNAAFARGAVIIDNTGFHVLFASSQTIAIGDPVPLTEQFFVQLSTGRVSLNAGTSPPARLSLPVSTVATEGINFGGDTNLYRAASGFLRTDSNMGLGPTAAVNGRLNFSVSTTIGGGINFGGDTNLYRSASGTLRVNESLIVGANISCPGGVVGGERFGSGAILNGDMSLAVGNSSVAGLNSIALGTLASANGSQRLAIGRGANASTNDSTAIGFGATASGAQSTAIGRSAVASSTNAFALGFAAQGTGQEAIAFGDQSVSNGLGSIVFGFLSKSNTFSSIVIGRRAEATASNQCIFGSFLVPMANVFFGKGASNAIPTVYTINGTAGLGTDIAGADVRIAGGRGTGTGNSGKVTIQTAPPGASGATQNALVNAGEFDASTTAGDTRLLLWDVDKGSLQRVSIGAADSGGTGFKVLRVPN